VHALPVKAREGGILALLMLVMVIELGVGLCSDGVTVDELLYIASGYRHLTALDFRANPSHPPLAKMLGALGLVGMSLDVPDGPAPGREWSWAYEVVQQGNDPERVIARARLVPCLETLLLVLLLWWWARSACGSVAGLAAVALAVFHPTLLAHGHLLTTDVPGALGMTATAWAFWRWTRAPRLRTAIGVALLLGLSVTARLTGWLALPAIGTLAALHALQLPASERRFFSRQVLLLAAVASILVPLVIWGVHGFRYAPWPGTTVAEEPGPWLGVAGRVVRTFEEWRVLPEAYLEGARFQLEHNLIGHPAYLLGQRSNTGWIQYYLVAIAVKNTPGFLIGLIAAPLLLLRRAAFAPSSVATHWAVSALLVFVGASIGRIQIGERYVLPVYPFAILLVAAAVPFVLATRAGRVLAVLALGLHALPSLLAAPGGYLSYFNRLAGGREGAHRVLLDSNLDWGQDLPRLAAWMKAHSVASVQLGYHGSDDPKRFGIAFESLPGLNLYGGPAPLVPFAGTVAVSPNLLMGLLGARRVRGAATAQARRPGWRVLHLPFAAACGASNSARISAGSELWPRAAISLSRAFGPGNWLAKITPSLRSFCPPPS
jgi:hypothetical protein